jgi:selenium metabolism protein YedF
MDTIDVRDLSCPEPVIRTKKALENSEDGKLIVILNSSEGSQNVQRFAKSQGCSVKASEKDGIFKLEINKGPQAEEKCPVVTSVILIASDQLGTGDEALGQLLITSFINALPESKNKPSKMLFINRGVILTTEGSRVLDTLQQLEAEGVQIFSCGTCLNHYQLKEKLKVGKVTNMYDIVDSLQTAEKVIRI